MAELASTATATARRVRPARAAASLGAVTLLFAALLWAFTASSYFFADDWLNFAQFREMGFGGELLRTGIFGNFSPGHRALDALVAGTTDASWVLARGVLLPFHVAAVGVCVALCRELGMRWRTALVVAALFAGSVALVRVLQWWASAAHIVPATFFTLVTLWAGVRWLRTRAVALLGVALVAQGLALAFYSKPVLCGLYLAALQFLVLSGGQDLGSRIRAVWGALPLWCAIGLPLAAYLAIISGPGYGAPEGHTTLGMWADFLQNTWLRGIAPSVIGQSVPGEPTSLNLVAVAVAQVLVLGFVAATIVRRPSALRAWAWFAVAVLFNVVMLGLGRLQVYGPGIGQDLRYLAELGFLWPLAAGLAVEAPPGTHRVPLLRRAQAALAAGERRLVRPRLAAAIAAVLAIAYVASYLGTADRISDAWTARQSRAYVDRLRASLERLRAEGQRPVLLDAAVPASVVAGAAPPYHLASRVVPEVAPDLPFDRPGGVTTVLEPDGRLEPARLQTVAEATPGAGLTASEGAGRDGGALCVAGPGSFGWQPPAGAPEDAVALRVEAEPDARARVLPVFADRGQGFVAGPERELVLQPGSGAALGGLAGQGLRALRIDVPPGAVACLRQLSLARKG